MYGRRGAVPLRPATPSPRYEVGNRVAYCVASGEARSVIAGALKLAGAEPLATTLLQLFSTLCNTRSCAALIHDLSPWDLSSVAQLERIRSEYPGLPILLYAPARAGVADLLLQCARVPCVRAELQQSAGAQETQRMRLVLRSLLDERPATRLLRMLETAIPGAPRRAWSFAQLALSAVRRGPAHRRAPGAPARSVRANPGTIVGPSGAPRAQGAAGVAQFALGHLYGRDIPHQRRSRGTRGGNRFAATLSDATPPAAGGFAGRVRRVRRRVPCLLRALPRRAASGRRSLPHGTNTRIGSVAERFPLQTSSEP